MQTLYISENNILRAFNDLYKRYNLFIPHKIEKDYTYKVVKEKIEQLIFPQHRLKESIKIFFTHPREKMTEYFNKDIKISNDKKTIIFGPKACDLHSLKILDYVFKNTDFKDLSFIEKRNNTLIISSDCTFYKQTCFCVKLSINPYPEKDFDLNLSPVDKGYLVTIGSDKGEKFIGENAEYFTKPDKEYIEQMNKKREAILQDVKKLCKDINISSVELLPERIRENFESEIWQDESKTCVECGGCNLVCPTCHCFLISDVKEADFYQRLRAWDSCLYKTFAKVAGGLNPRVKLSQRLRNRFIKKFDFFPKVLGVVACTGCGRCIEVCLGEIDIRKVLEKLSGSFQAQNTK